MYCEQLEISMEVNLLPPTSIEVNFLNFSSMEANFVSMETTMGVSSRSKRRNNVTGRLGELSLRSHVSVEIVRKGSETCCTPTVG